MIADDPLPAMLDADGIIDFSAPAASVEMAALAAQARIAHVIGTTGLTEADLAENRRRGAPRADRALRQHEPRRQSAGASWCATPRARSGPNSTSRSSRCTIG